MKEKWKSVCLGECFKIKHGWAFKGKFFAKEGKYILLTPGNFNPNGGIKLKGDKEKYYSGDFPKEFLLKFGDFLAVMTDLTQDAPILGSPAFVKENDRFLHNQRLGKIVDLDETEMDRVFLYYLFNSSSVRNQIKATATGATVKHTAPDRIYNVAVNLPSLPTQRKIATVLSTYDDLIENNTRRIEILEEMAQAIYREWFVEFRFPGHEEVEMVESELGLIPQGWEVKQLGEIVAEIIDYRGKTPKKLGGDWAESGIMALSAMNVKQGRLVNLEKAKFISEELYKIWMKSEIAKNDILMTSEAPLGEIYYLTEKKKICLSQRLFCIRANPNIIKSSIMFYAIGSPVIQGQLQANATGTTVLGIRQAALRKISVIIPPLRLQSKAESVLGTLITTKEILEKKNTNLRQTRDLLLRKLISGEIDISELDIDTDRYHSQKGE